MSERVQFWRSVDTAIPPSVLGIALNQRSNQLQKCLMLGMFAVLAEKRADLDIAHLSAGRGLALCLTNNLPVPGSRTRYHLSPFGLL